MAGPLPLRDGGVALVDRAVALRDGGVALVARAVALRDGGVALVARRVALVARAVALVAREVALRDVAVALVDGAVALRDVAVALVDVAVALVDVAVALVDIAVALVDVAIFITAAPSPPRRTRGLIFGVVARRSGVLMLRARRACGRAQLAPAAPPCEDDHRYGNRAEYPAEGQRMRNWRAYDFMPKVAPVATFVGALWLLPGCIIWDGTPGASGGASEADGDPSTGAFPTACPRTADIGGTSGRAGTREEVIKANEVCQWTIADYKEHQWDVLYTVQMPSGDVYDYIKVSSLADPDLDPPPMMLPDLTLPPGFAGFLQTELGMNPALGGPPNTQLRVRPDFSLYISGNTGATSVEDFLANYQPAGTPTGGGRLYAGIKSTKDPLKKLPPQYTLNLGASAWVMPYVGSIEEGTMSLLEMAVGCRNSVTGEMEQQIGVAASMDYANTRFSNFGDSVLRIQVEFMTHGDHLLGPGKGGWHGTSSTNDFHPYPSKDNPLAPGMRLYPSTVGGPGFATLFWLRLWNKNWWIGVNGVWIGYYPGDPLFVNNGNFDLEACEALWYAEANNPGYDPDSNPKKEAPKWSPLGSGHFAEERWGKASFFAYPTYLDKSEIPRLPDQGDQLSPSNAECYTTTGLTKGVEPFEPFDIVYVGGPGTVSSKCLPPAPPAPPPPKP